MSGRRFIKIFLSTFLTLLWISLTSITPAQDASSIKAIVGATLVNTNGKKPIKNAVILVEGSKIIKVGTGRKVKIPKGAEIIDAKGKWIIPGLVDAHIHFFQSAGLYTRPDVIDLRKFVAYEEEELAQIRENLPDTFARIGSPNHNYRPGSTSSLLPTPPPRMPGGSIYTSKTCRRTRRTGYRRSTGDSGTIPIRTRKCCRSG